MGGYSIDGSIALDNIISNLLPQSIYRVPVSL
jgi:hypothetical protein